MIGRIKEMLRTRKTANLMVNKYSDLIRSQNQISPFWMMINARSSSADDVGRRLVQIYENGGHIPRKAWPLMFFQVYSELRYTKNQVLSFRHQIEILEKQKRILLEKADNSMRHQVQCLEMERKS